MATEFVCKINKTGEDYGDLASWESALQADFTSSATKVFSHSGITGTISDGASVTGTLSGATGTAAHASTTQIMIKSISGTFQSGEIVYQTLGVNLITLSNAGDSVVVVASVYDDDGPLEGTLDIDGSTSGPSNYMKVTVPIGDRHSGTPASGATLTKTSSASFDRCIFVLDSYVVIEWLVIKMTSNHADVWGIIMFLCGFDTSQGANIRNNVIQRVGGSSTTRVSGIHGANNNGWFKSLDNVIIGFPSGINLLMTGNIISNTTTKGCTVGVDDNDAGGHTATISNHLSIADTTGFANNVGDSSSTNNLAEDTSAHFGATYDTGTTTSTSTNKLIDSGGDFVVAGVQVGSIVANVTDSTYTYITSVDSSTQLTLANDIFVSGKDFYVFKSFRGSVTCVDKTNNDLHLVVGDTNAINRGANLGSTYGVNYDIDNYDRTTGGAVWDIGADEFVGGSNATVNPSVLSIVPSVQAPTVTVVRNVSVSPSVLSIVASVQAPTVTAVKNVSVSAGVLSIIASVVAPTVSAIKNATISPGVLSVIASVNAPSLILGRTISPNVLSAVVSLPAPSVSAGGNVSISVGILSAVASAISPSVSVSASVTVSPAVLGLVVSGQAPAVSSQAIISTSVLSTVASVISPSPSGSASISPSVLSITCSAISPSITTIRNVSVSLGVQGLIASLNSPSLSIGGNVTVSVSVISISANKLDPSVFAESNTSVSVSVLSCVASKVNPSLSMGAIVSPNTLILNAEINSPSLMLNRIIFLSNLGLTVTPNSPSIITQDVGVSILLDCLALTAALNNPNVDIDSLVRVLRFKIRNDIEQRVKVY